MEQGPVCVGRMAHAQNDAVEDGYFEAAMTFPVSSWETLGNVGAAAPEGKPEGF